MVCLTIYTHVVALENKFSSIFTVIATVNM